MKICQCNPPYKQTERKKTHISLDIEKAFDKIQHPFNKSLGESKDTRNIPKHNKGNIQQANSQHQTKWRKQSQ